MYNFSFFIIFKKIFYFIFKKFPSLESKLSSAKTLDLETKLVWCKDLTFALDYFHMHNQVHKKVFPA